MPEEQLQRTLCQTVGTRTAPPRDPRKLEESVQRLRQISRRPVHPERPCTRVPRCRCKGQKSICHQGVKAHIP